MRNAWGILFLLWMVWGCSPNEDAPIIPLNQATPFEIEIPFGFPTMLTVPEDNPMTVEGIELGRILFYDGRIAGQGENGLYLSCSSCHLQDNAFTIGAPRPQPVGINGDSTHHSMLPLVNLIWNPGHFNWDGSVQSIEEEVLGALTHPDEFNTTFEKVVNAIAAIEGYPPLFQKAFGTPEVTIERISKAIAQFVRTLISSNSRFDRYLRGELQITPQELEGYILFTTEEGADCFHCHGGGGNPLFTTHLFYNNGTDAEFTDPYDRYAITGDPMDIGAYKAPTLRNIALTAPYMHDGRFNTLDEVIDFYSEGLQYSPSINPLMHHIGNGGNLLLPDEKEALKTFLLSLTDTSFVNNPAYACPETFPE